MPYIGKSPSAIGVRSRFYFTATGGETSLSGADDNGKTLVFTDAAYVDVILNGNNLVSGSDYTATPSTNTISGLTALVASDVVEIISYDVFSVADTVPASTGGTFSGGLTVPSLTTTGDISFGDNDKAIFGAGSDLKIYHDGSNSYVEDAGTGDIIIKGDYIRLQDVAGGNLLVADANDAVQLYHGYSQKLSTTSSGVDVTGTATATSFETDAGGTFTTASGNDLNIVYPLNRSLFIKEDTQTHLTINNVGNVGIGGTTASSTGFVRSLNLEGSDVALQLRETTTNSSWEIGNDNTGLFRVLNNGSDKMKIDSSGRVTMPYQPAFSVKLASNNVHGTSAATIVYTSVDHNIGSHYSTSTGRFTAPISGVYHFDACTLMNLVTASSVAYARMYWIKNGSIFRDNIGDQGSYGTYQRVSGSLTASLSANDTIEIQCLGNNSGAYTYLDYSWFCGHLVG